MKALIVGIGGVGGYFGGKLAKAYGFSPDHSVVFVARGEHLRKIREEGLAVSTKDEGNWIARPDLVTDRPADAGQVDIVLFSVKGYDLEQSAELVKPCIHEGTAVISLLNGIDNAERLSAVIDRGHILNGCVYISAYLAAPGSVTQVGGPCTLFFGPETGPVEPYRPVEQFLKDGGVKATLTDDIASALWSKYIFVGPLGGVTSLSGKSLGGVIESEELRSMLAGMMEEVKAVASARDIVLPEDIVKNSIDMASNFPYETKTSIQLDFEKGNRTELDTFVGFLVKAARDLSIDAPLHERVYRELAARERR
ncbi:MAG TPA: 2-dehydropantoate 2-reductase [Deltaproteobacteria bacterium]|nr:2-dehydropantoate 2-reductase [Deltaproteobacteria bacterium]